MLGFILLLMPFAIQVLNTPAGYEPTGFIAGGYDYATFIAKMQWGAEGHWTYINRYTTEPTERAPIYGFYLLLGHLSAWTGMSLVWVYHLARALLGSLGIVLLWAFLKAHIKSRTWLVYLLSITCMAGYWEYIDGVLGTSVGKMDLFLQAKLGTVFFTYPHYLVDLLAFMAIFHAYLGNMKIRKRIVFAAVGGFLLSAIHVFLMALVAMVLLGHGALNKRLKEALTVATASTLAALPYATIQYIAFSNLHWLQVWRDATNWPWVNPLILLLAIHGVTGLLAWLNIAREVRVRQISFWTVWVLVASVMSYAMPLQNKIEYTFFLALPLGTLASYPAERFLIWLENKKPAVNGAGVVLLLLLTVAYPTVWMVQLFKPGLSTSGTYPAYIPVEYVETVKSLDKEPAIVLCHTYAGNYLPALTANLKPYCAHPMETQKFDVKDQKVKAFFKGNCPDLPRESGAQYVVCEDIYTSDSNLQRLTEQLGRPVISKEHVTVWKIK